MLAQKFPAVAMQHQIQTMTRLTDQRVRLRHRQDHGGIDGRIILGDHVQGHRHPAMIDRAEGDLRDFRMRADGGLDGGGGRSEGANRKILRCDHHLANAKAQMVMAGNLWHKIPGRSQHFSPVCLGTSETNWLYAHFSGPLLRGIVVNGGAQVGSQLLQQTAVIWVGQTKLQIKSKLRNVIVQMVLPRLLGGLVCCR